MKISDQVKISIYILCQVMESDMIYRFQASVLPEHHKLLNMKLNELVVKSSSLERDTRWQEKKASSLEEYPPLLIKYKHEKSRDSFYDHPTLGKLRATFKKASTNTINDAKTPASHSRDHEELKYVLQKKRISDLAILFPLFPFDVRISVNQEIPSNLVVK